MYIMTMYIKRDHNKVSELFARLIICVLNSEFIEIEQV